MNRKSLKANTIFNAVKTCSSIAFPLITFPYVSRVLLAENVGKINFGLSIVSYFSLIASLGITTYAIRECSGVRNDKDRLSKTASQIFSINIVSTVAAYLALALTLIFYHKLDQHRLLIIIQSFSIVATTLGADWLNSAMEDFRYITLRTIAFQMVSFILMFIFIHKPEDYMKYALISLLSSAGASMANIWYRRRYCRVYFTLKIEWKRHMTPVLLLFAMILAQTLFNNVDITMIGIIIGDTEVGYYSSAHKIMNLINQVVASICWVLMPRLSFYFAEQDFSEINRLLRRTLAFNLTVGLPCITGVCMLAKDIILVAAGYGYLPAVPVLQILMLAFAFMLVGGNFLGNEILLPSRQEKYFMVVCCIATAVNIAANSVIIPLYGAEGAAATTAFSEMLMFVLLLCRKDKRIVLKPLYKLVIPPVVGCIAIVVCCAVMSGVQQLWLRLFLSVASSVTVFFIIQLLMKNDIVLYVYNSIKSKIRSGGQEI